LINSKAGINSIPTRKKIQPSKKVDSHK